jgi:hypothetical protein
MATGDNRGVALRLEQAAQVDLGTYWGDTLDRCGPGTPIGTMT